MEGSGQNSPHPNPQAQITEFLSDKGPIEHLQRLAGSLLARDSILKVIQVMDIELWDRFVNKVYQVRHLACPQRRFVDVLPPRRYTLPSTCPVFNA